MTTHVGCPVCSETKIVQSAYMYLLGLYLGDGCLSRQSRNSWKLRIVQDARYMGLVALCADAMETVRGPGKARYVDRGTYIEIHSSWEHWLCLFPQHGPGPKHKRAVALNEWQLEQLAHHEKDLISGLIHSDGTHHINRVVRPTKAGMKTYSYQRYQFKNRSDDIRGIFTDALDALGVRWTAGGHMTVSVARRDDVRFLSSFVSPKQ